MAILKTKRKRSDKQKQTFSKRMVAIIIGFGILDIQLAYVLALLDKQVPETLTVAIVTEIVGVALGYFIKSFRETREEENMKFKRDRDNLSESEEEI